MLVRNDNISGGLCFVIMVGMNFDWEMLQCDSVPTDLPSLLNSAEFSQCEQPADVC